MNVLLKNILSLFIHVMPNWQQFVVLEILNGRNFYLQVVILSNSLFSSKSWTDEVLLPSDSNFEQQRNYHNEGVCVHDKGNEIWIIVAFKCNLMCTKIISNTMNRQNMLIKWNGLLLISINTKYLTIFTLSYRDSTNPGIYQPDNNNNCKIHKR